MSGQQARDLLLRLQKMKHLKNQGERKKDIEAQIRSYEEQSKAILAEFQRRMVVLQDRVSRVKADEKQEENDVLRMLSEFEASSKKQLDERSREIDKANQRVATMLQQALKKYQETVLDLKKDHPTQLTELAELQRSLEKAITMIKQQHQQMENNFRDLNTKIKAKWTQHQKQSQEQRQKLMRCRVSLIEACENAQNRAMQELMRLIANKEAKRFQVSNKIQELLAQTDIAGH